MRFGWGKLVILLVMSVAVLQIVHMLLLSRLEVKEAGTAQKRAEEVSRGSVSEGVTAGHDAEDLRDMVNAVQGSSVLDSSGEFKIVNFLAQAESLKLQKNGYEDVTLVTQCSSDHLAHLDALSRSWDGPISVTVFATKDDLPDTLIAVAELRRCLPAVRYNTSFHLVYPLSHHRQQDLHSMVAKTTNKWSVDDCSRFSAPGRTTGTADGQTANYERVASPYPNNLLRNVARRNALTEFVFVVDVDTLPNEALHRDFMAFAAASHLFADSKKDDKTVYVVPAFEAREFVDVPRDKGALLRLVEAMQVRPFYFELCWKCQKHTDYDAWQREPLTPRLQVVFEVLWKDPWEPFYIGRNTGPLYDERFKQYGFNRISQVCELHIAGYKFSVLNNAFLIHRGLKTMDSFHKKKDEDQERNRLLFRQFKAELKEKYPDSSRRCY